MLTDYQVELMTVLDEFFVVVTEGFINPRADKEIEQYQLFRESGKRGAAKRWTKGDDSPPIDPPKPPQTTPNAKHKPLTINHKTNNTLTYELGIGWLNYESFFEKAQIDFPYVDLHKEFDKASAWLREKPEQRLKKDYNRFMLSWIKRVNESLTNPNDIFAGAI